MSEYIDVTYGQCYTCYKDGGGFPATDYVYGAEYSDVVRGMLNSLGLPFPDDKRQVFRGTRRDMLFLDSHGVVIKIGLLDPYDLVTPAFLQPLKWVQAEPFKQSLTAAVYGGIPLLEEDDLLIVDDLERFCKSRGQGFHDYWFYNVGLVDVEGKPEAVMLDVDNMANNSSVTLKQKREELTHRLVKQFSRASDIMEVTMQELYCNSNSVEVDRKMQVFYAHQLLRHMFDDALGDPDKLKEVWNTCKEVTNNPKYDVELPIWKQVNGQYVSDKMIVPKIELKTPWENQEVGAKIKHISEAIKAEQLAQTQERKLNGNMWIHW